MEDKQVRTADPQNLQLFADAGCPGLDTGYELATSASQAVDSDVRAFRDRTHMIRRMGKLMALSSLFAFVFVCGVNLAKQEAGTYIPKKLRFIHTPHSAKHARPSTIELEAPNGIIEQINGESKIERSEAEKTYLRAQVCSLSYVGDLSIPCSPAADVRWLVKHGDDVKPFANPTTMATLEMLHLGRLEGTVTTSIAREKAAQKGSFSLPAFQKSWPGFFIASVLMLVAIIRYAKVEVILRRLHPDTKAGLPNYTSSYSEEIAHFLVQKATGGATQDSSSDD